MDVSSEVFPPAQRRRPWYERGAALAIALALEIALVLLLIFAFALPPKPKGPATTLTAFDIGAGDSEADAAKAEKEKPAPKRGAEPKDAVRPIEPPKIVPPEPPPVPLPDSVTWVSRREFAAAAIEGKKADANAADAPAAHANAGTGRMSGDSRPAGRAPNGEPMYVAEWYREPTDVELRTYRPDLKESGWGEIACRTVANYRVEDCVELGDAPRGSRYAGAVRQAAFQFRVRPPRLGGKALIGAWVRIHIEYGFTLVEK